MWRFFPAVGPDRVGVEQPDALQPDQGSVLRDQGVPVPEPAAAPNILSGPAGLRHGRQPLSPVFPGSSGSRAPERFRGEVTRTPPEEPAQAHGPAARIDMPAGACLESARRLGASNPPLAGTLVANLALGG